MITTHNGAPQYETALNHCVEFFSKAGSLRADPSKQSYYDGETTALTLFQNIWSCGGVAARQMAMKLLFWCRDPRGGAGNRSGAREIIRWLCKSSTGKAWIAANIANVPAYGRWDDLVSCFGTEVEKAAAKLWCYAVTCNDHLAVKWAKRDMKPLQRQFGLDERGLRKLLVSNPGRKTVEQQITANKWDEVQYPAVPSVAMKRYTNAFRRHDTERFNTYLENVKAGKQKINASVLFPYQCMASALQGNADVADAQFAALPDYLESTDARIMAIVDTSGSMQEAAASGNTTLLNIAVSLGLYCSDRLPEPFHRRYMEFSDEAKLIDWRGKLFSQACREWGGSCANTNIAEALRYLISCGTMLGATDATMPNMLLIISDMQFDDAYMYTEMTPVESALKDWDAAGYKRPRIVYWNLAGYCGQPATAEHTDVALVSGFSPSILKAILAGKTIGPVEVMELALERYNVIVPG